MARHAAARPRRSSATELAHERELAALRARDARAERFVSTVAHELRTPLTGLNGYLDLILDGRVDDPAIEREFIERSRVIVDAMAELVGDLLELSRLESGTPGPRAARRSRSRSSATRVVHRARSDRDGARHRPGDGPAAAAADRDRRPAPGRADPHQPGRQRPQVLGRRRASSSWPAGSTARSRSSPCATRAPGSGRATATASSTASTGWPTTTGRRRHRPRPADRPRARPGDGRRPRRRVGPGLGLELRPRPARSRPVDATYPGRGRSSPGRRRPRRSGSRSRPCCGRSARPAGRSPLQAPAREPGRGGRGDRPGPARRAGSRPGPTARDRRRAVAPRAARPGLTPSRPAIRPHRAPSCPRTVDGRRNSWISPLTLRRHRPVTSGIRTRAGAVG